MESSVVRAVWSAFTVCLVLEAAHSTGQGDTHRRDGARTARAFAHVRFSEMRTPTRSASTEWVCGVLSVDLADR